ncbi:MAG TPA: hypothetical protein VFF67_03995 [Thermoplasmata archaeon]|nr:hypothetical protein [Thermoplasmata archaeon]
MTYSQLQLCSGGGAFEAIPRPRRSVDLGRIKERLLAQRIEVVDARVMLIVRMEREVTLSRDGRVLIKSRDPAEASRLFDQLRTLVSPMLSDEDAGGAVPPVND